MTKPTSDHLDEALALSHTHCLFKPWVGVDYAKGYHGLRTLLLGESHYGDTTYGPEWHTIDCAIHYGIKRVEPQKFYSGVHAAVGVDEEDADARKAFWSQAAFNNYVQVMLDGSKKRPNASDWASGTEPFKEMLRRLRPQLILVFGHTMWWKMPDMGKVLPQIGVKPFPRPAEAYRYDYEVGTALAVQLLHPSRNPNKERARAVVRAAVAACKRNT